MNEYWKQQAGLTHDEKRVFVERTLADQADSLHSLRTIHSAAENRMLTRVACRGGEYDEDGDDASLEKPV